jgi:hypothetical protein
MNVDTLDQIMKRFGIQTVNYLSLDVEGFEFNVLSGYSKTPQLLSIEKPNNRCRRILQNKHMKLLKSLGNFGEEFWIAH